MAAVALAFGAGGTDAAFAQSAQASVKVKPSKTVLKAGARGSVMVRSTAATSCTLVARSAGRVQRGARVRLRGAGSAGWRFRVPADARSAKWKVLVTCSGRSSARRLRVRGQARSGARKLARRGFAKVGYHAAHSDDSGGDPPAGNTGRANCPPRNRAKYDPMFCTPGNPWDNTTPTGYGCQYWAYEKRPEIVERARARTANGYDWQIFDKFNFEGYAWADTARQLGFPVSYTPHAGDIAVFDPGEYNAGNPGGHVAYVERVNPDGETIFISQYSASTQAYSERTIGYKGYDAYDRRYDGLEFIDR